MRRKTSSSSMSANRMSRSEEHTSELQSHRDLVCRLLLEKKKLKVECELDRAAASAASCGLQFWAGALRSLTQNRMDAHTPGCGVVLRRVQRASSNRRLFF